MPKTREYDRNKLDLAIRDVQNKTESYRSAERKYGIPKSTIEFKMKHPEHKSTFGPSPILTEKEEELLVKWVKDTARTGFPRKANDLKSSVQIFLNENPRPNPFTNNRPGNGWLNAFLKRHPDISQRTSEPVTSASACVSEKDIRHWFTEIGNYIEEKGLENVIADPSRVFNGDESGFQICPATGKVFAQKGSKNVYTIDKGSSKENITVMFTFSANGGICVPMIIYPYQRLPEKITKTINPKWGVGRSDNGWMTSETFYEYIANVFHPHLVDNKVKFPVILFLDGHKSHLNYALSRLCNDLQIEVIALYPNATRILQPCDVAVFRSLKEAWRRKVREWNEEHPGEVLNKIYFAPLLDKAIKSSLKPETLINGFKACGLCPFNANQIDYSKCLGGAEDKDPQDDSLLPNSAMAYSTFADIVGQEKIGAFKSLSCHLPDDVNDDFLDLFKIWKHYNDQMKSKDNPNKNISKTKINIIENIVVQSIPTQAEPQTIEEEAVAVLADLSKDVDQSRVLCEITNSPKPSTSKFIQSKLFGDFLISPETPKRKGKRNVERFPFAITSEKYQEMYDKKRLIKENQEKEKEERKRKREDKIRSKSKRKNKASICFVCNNRIDNGGRQCDDCKKYVHQECVPKRHKQYVPEDQDELFMCHLCYKLQDTDEDISDENIETYCGNDRYRS